MGDVDRLDDSARQASRQRQQSVVRADQQTVVGDPQRHRAALGAHIGIDNREVDANRQVWQRSPQHDRSGPDIVAGDPMREVDHTRLRTDRGDHRMAEPDEVVLHAVVRQERDHRRAHAATRSSQTRHPGIWSYRMTI